MRKYIVRYLIAVGLGLSACESVEGPLSASSATAITAHFNQATVDDALSNMVQSEQVLGAAGLIYKDGQEVYFGAYGLADREADRPWTRDALVNIYSMTKPVTGVTLMSLYEDGLFELDDPLSKYLPEFSKPQVLMGTDENGDMILEAANRPITIRDIMRHTAGFGYGWTGDAIDTAMRDQALLSPSKPLSEFSQGLAALPLKFHPGAEWKYSVSVDVQARLAEVLAKQPYEDLVQARVLGPLGMSETGYFVPAVNKNRVTPVYIRNEDGSFTREPDSQVYGLRTEKPVQINGGHGLVSTLDDYMRFSRMLLNNGSLDGVEILKPETIALMSKDHLPTGLTELDFLPGKGQVGFGLDFAVRTAPPATPIENVGEVGEFFWDGRASTLFWVDPKNDLTAVFFVQVVPFDGDLHYSFRKAVYEALK